MTSFSTFLFLALLVSSGGTSGDALQITNGGTGVGDPAQIRSNDKNPYSVVGEAGAMSKVVATPGVSTEAKVDREMANPLTPLEISERLRNFAENLNVYMQKLSLAGIVAAEAATRVQVQASLAELALLALKQVDQIHKMQSGVKQEIVLTLSALSNVVTKDNSEQGADDQEPESDGIYGT